jgi:hypothetical protein
MQGRPKRGIDDVLADDSNSYQGTHTSQGNSLSQGAENDGELLGGERQLLQSALKRTRVDPATAHTPMTTPTSSYTRPRLPAQPQDVAGVEMDHEVAGVDLLEDGLVALEPAADESRTYDHQLQTMQNEHQQNMMSILKGSDSDLQAFHAQFALFTAEDWETLATTLLQSNLDMSAHSDQDVLTTLNLFYQLFCYEYTDLGSVVVRMKALYSDVNQLKQQYKRIQTIYGALHIELVKRDMLSEDAIGIQFSHMLTEIAFFMKSTFDGMLTFHMIQHGQDRARRSLLETMNPFSFFQEIDMVKLKKNQQLLHFYYHEAFRHKLRKEGESLYRPKYNAAGQYVYAYEYVYDVADFVFSSLYPLEQNHYWFDCLTDRTNPSSIIKILVNLKSEWLQEHRRNRLLHSFRNGMYRLDNDTFYYWSKKPGKHSIDELQLENMVAVKYHDIDFDEEGMTREMESSEVKNYMSIRIDHVSSILSTQRFNMEERRWILALLGRLLYALGDKDQWQVFLFFLGLAGTGKSTLLRLLSRVFEARDVGYLSNALQKQFALDGIQDKLIWLALDLDSNWQMDQVTFQSMVSGEEVSVVRKFKIPFVKVWDIPGAAAANKLPEWKDNGGSLGRRLFVIEFLKLVNKCDPNLFQKCEAQLDRFLKVINAAYLELCANFSGSGLKDAAPAKFKLSEKKALGQMDLVGNFIRTCCTIDQRDYAEQDEDDPLHSALVQEDPYLTPFRVFQKAFKEFCQKTSVRPPVLNYTLTNPTFMKFRVMHIESPLPDDPFHQSEAYLLGLRMKENVLVSMTD